MRASLNQIVLVQETDFGIGGLTVCPSQRLVITAEGRELLQPRIMQVLVALARRKGEVVSRDELMALCWGGFAVSDDAIHRCIARIRRLGEAYGGFILETVPRVGYQLIETDLAVASEDEAQPREEVSQSTPEEHEAAGPALGPQPLRWFQRSSVAAAAGFALGVLVTAAGFIGAHLF